MTSDLIRVVIADDHPIVRAGLYATLAKEPQITVVGIASSFTDVLVCLKGTGVDIVVLDLGGMGSTPLTMVARLLREYPVGYVIFSSSIDLAPELLQAGVQGYVVKEELAEHLVLAIHAVYAKTLYLSPIVQSYIERTRNLHQRKQPTAKELQALKLLARGNTTEAIAVEMGIDPRSVQNYITALLRKTGSPSRVQLVMWYRRVYGDDDVE